MMQQDGEASIQDILASIKKVMERDSEGGQDSESGRGEAGDLSGDPVEDEGAEPRPAAANPALTGSNAILAVRESLAALARVSRPGTEPQIGASGDESLDIVTRAMLRPMIAEWLDANLPAMVERMVEAEIARIVERRT
jgi:cell pole-organizing protein PopZ